MGLPVALFSHIEPGDQPCRLVMEESSVLLHKSDAELLGSAEDSAVVLATGGGSNVLDPGAGNAEDIVDEGELNMYC